MGSETRIFDLRVNDGANTPYLVVNDNAKDLKIWRYQHYRSHAPFAQKKALVIACLRKVHKMASDREWQLFDSAIDKLREFVNLSYPLNLLRSACSLLAYTSGVRTWLAVRNSIDDIDTTRLRA